VDVHHGDEAENQERWQEPKVSPFLARQMSKWIYDTSTQLTECSVASCCQVAWHYSGSRRVVHSASVAL
jgi:hypothetical protein